MEELALVEVTGPEGPFARYVPENFRPQVGRRDWLCVGAVWRNMACAAAVAQLVPESGWHLRYIYVDPAARGQGLGTYLLRGLLGQVKARWGRQIRAVWTAGMVESGEQVPGVLARAGFSPPEPVGTVFSVPLGRIPELKPFSAPGLAVYDGLHLPPEVEEEYHSLLWTGEIPPFADSRDMEGLTPQLSSFCTASGQLAGVLLGQRTAEGLNLAGLWVRPSCRKGRTAALLIARSLSAARRAWPPDTWISTTAIDRTAFELALRFFRPEDGARRETELMAVCPLCKEGVL